jgi:hypothetical protein
MNFCKKRRYLRVLALLAMLHSADAKISSTHSLTSNISATQTETVPQDAEELLLSAAQVNGLEAPGLKPWHILATFDKFDEDGDNVDSGTYEEVWISARQYRVTHTSKDFTQTDVATDAGLYRTGNEKCPPIADQGSRRICPTNVSRVESTIHKARKENG